MKNRIAVRVKSIEPSEDGKGISIRLSSETGDGRGPLPEGFDPWTARLSPEEVLTGIGTPAVDQYIAAQAICQLGERINGGDGNAVLDAVSVIARHGLVMPGWLALAFLHRYKRFQSHAVSSLDEAFDIPRQSERERASREKWRALIPVVSERLKSAVLANPAVPIDNLLFEEVGEALGIGRTLCRKLYDQGVRHHGCQDLKKLKKMFNRQQQKRPPK